MNANPCHTPEDRLVWDVVFNRTALRHPTHHAQTRAAAAVAAWQRYGSHGAPADHPHRALFHKVGHAAERRASLGDRVNQALEHENRPAKSSTRRARIQARAILAQQDTDQQDREDLERCRRDLIRAQHAHQQDLEHLELTRRVRAELGHPATPDRRLDLAAGKVCDLEDRRSWVTPRRDWQRRAEERAALSPRVQTSLDLENAPVRAADRQDVIRRRGALTTVRRAHLRRTRPRQQQGVSGL